MIRPKQPRKPLSQKKYVELKKYVFNRDGWCLQCGFSGTLTPAHIKRRSDGALKNIILFWPDEDDSEKKK